jgi:two-component system, LytTR family, sensor kinase
MPLMGILFTMLSYLFTPDTIDQICRNKFGYWYLGIDTFFNLLLILIVSESSIYLCKELDKRGLWHTRTWLAILIQYVVHGCFSFVITSLLFSLNEAVYGFPVNYITGTELELFLIYTTVITFSFLISSSYTLAFVIDKLKASIIQTETAQRATAEAQIAALRSQLDPHFLFNSLNTLTALIEESPQDAVYFVREMSAVYRHVLRSDECVSLSDELAFAEHYIALMKIRFGDAISYNVSVGNEFKSIMIPAMTLQLLLENVFKHTVISSDFPVVINVLTKQSLSDNQVSTVELIIENTVRPKLNSHRTSTVGIGLDNLRKRLLHLTKNSLVIEQTNELFRVIISLNTSHNL